jgi:hypothetical protein
MKKAVILLVLAVTLGNLVASEIPSLAVFRRQEDRQRARRQKYQSLCGRQNALVEAVAYRMAQTGEYQLVERNALERIIAEYHLLESDWSAQPGWDAGLIAADFLLIVSVNRVDETVKERTLTIADVKIMEYRASSRVSLSLIEVSTGKITRTWTGTKTASAREIRQNISFAERRDWTEAAWADAGIDLLAEKLVSELVGPSERIEPDEPEEPKYPKTESPKW